jgi:hypothetical protein
MEQKIKKITHSKIWQIDYNMVVADTIEEAISTYKEYYNDTEIKSIRAVEENGRYVPDNTVMIRK